MMMFGVLMMLAMVVGIVVVSILIGVGIWLAIRWIGRQSPRLASPDRYPAVNQPSALDLLRERYARGEIDTDMFSDMVERLEAPTAPTDRHDPFPTTRP